LLIAGIVTAPGLAFAQVANGQAVAFWPSFART